jgi:hypothetical protein
MHLMRSKVPPVVSRLEMPGLTTTELSNTVRANEVSFDLGYLGLAGRHLPLMHFLQIK